MSPQKSLVGIVSAKLINIGLTSFKITPADAVQKVMSKEMKILKDTDCLQLVTKAFNRHPALIILDNKGNYFICEPKNLLDHYLKNSK